MLELTSQFNPFLAARLSWYGKDGKGKPFYLSKTVCEDLLS